MKAAIHVGAGLPAIARDFIAYVFVNSDLQSRAGLYALGYAPIRQESNLL